MTIILRNRQNTSNDDNIIFCTKTPFSKSQSTDLQSKSISWFPYDTSLHWKVLNSNSNNEVKHFTLIILLFQKKCIKPGKIMELLGNSIQPIRRYSLQYPSPIFLSSIGSALSVLSIKVIVQSSKKTIMPMRSKMFKSICLHMFYPSFSFSVAILIVVPAITKWIGSRAYIFANHKFYTIKDKLDIYHSNSSCYFFCIAF